MMRTALVTLVAVSSFECARAQDAPGTLDGAWRGADRFARVGIADGHGLAIARARGEITELWLFPTSARGFGGAFRSPSGGGTLALTLTDAGALHGWMRNDDGDPANDDAAIPLHWERIAQGAHPLPPGVRIEVFEDAAAFTKACGPLRTVGFDDVAVAGDEPIPIDPTRYRREHGLVLHGTEGQFVHTSFGYPDSYVPASPPNVFAPGPPNQGADSPNGGHQTAVTFRVAERLGAVAAFGCTFVDADHPHLASTGFIAFAGDRVLARIEGVQTPNGGHAFRGVLARDADGTPLPVISRLRIVSGNVWAGLDRGDGVVLDDFVFTQPCAR